MVDFLVALMSGLAITFILILPLLAIPVIFFKMGSVAGKVQGAFNNIGRGMRKQVAKGATKAAGGAAKRRGLELAAQRAKNRPETRTGRAANYALNRKAVASSRDSSISRALEDAHYQRIGSSEAYAAKVGGISGPGKAHAAERAHREKRFQEDASFYKDTMRADNLSTNQYLDRARTAADPAESYAAAQLALETGGGFAQSKVREILDSQSSMSGEGAGGVVRAARESGDMYLSNPELVDTIQHFGDASYAAGVAGGTDQATMIDTAKTETDPATGQQKTQSDFWQGYTTKIEKVLKLSGDGTQVAAIKDPSNGMTYENAVLATKSPNFSSANQKIRDAIQAVVARGPKNPASQASTPPPATSGSSSSGPTLIVPRSSGQNPTMPPSTTQQQRQQGGNFNGGPGQQPPSNP